MHSGRRAAHTNLRLVDRIRFVGYAEDTLQWTTDTAEETDSQFDSILQTWSDSLGMTVRLTFRPYSVCSNRF